MSPPSAVRGGDGRVRRYHHAARQRLHRWRERLADRYALVTTRKPGAFISAMTRLANQNLSEVDPEPWVEFILYSHPAIGKRIAMARSNYEG